MFFPWFCVFPGRNPYFFLVCGVRVKGGGVAHVCKAHWLVDYVVNLLLCCKPFVLWEGVVSLRSYDNCRMFVRFSSLNIVHYTFVFVFRIGYMYCVGNWTGCGEVVLL